MYKLPLLFVFLFVLPLQKVFSQKDSSNVNAQRNTIGLAIQYYPAGIIGTLNVQIPLQKHDFVIYRLGGNFANRKTFSPYNDYEKGGGFGASVGYQKYFILKRGKIVAGINTDIWNMWIHWENDMVTSNPTTGKTYTLVLQPWVEAGYFLNFKNSNIQIGLTTGFGREINIVTNGKGVGQGWINSALLYFQYSL